LAGPKIQKPLDLLASHYAEIGLYALDNDFYAIGLEWLEHSKWKILEEKDTSLSLEKVDEYLKKAILWVTNNRKLIGNIYNFRNLAQHSSITS
jgi:hypothetical protein